MIARKRRWYTVGWAGKEEGSRGKCRQVRVDRKSSQQRVGSKGWTGKDGQVSEERQGWTGKDVNKRVDRKEYAGQVDKKGEARKSREGKSSGVRNLSAGSVMYLNQQQPVTSANLTPNSLQKNGQVT